MLRSVGRTGYVLVDNRAYRGPRSKLKVLATCIRDGSRDAGDRRDGRRAALLSAPRTARVGSFAGVDGLCAPTVPNVAHVLVRPSFGLARGSFMFVVPVLVSRPEVDTAVGGQLLPAFLKPALGRCDLGR